MLEACHAHAAVAAVPQRLETGRMYLMRELLCDNWYRVRILSGTSSPSDSATSTFIEVSYVDYGNTERVRNALASNRFRAISGTLNAQQPAARACSLYALRTLDVLKATWRKEAKMLMSTIVAK